MIRHTILFKAKHEIATSEIDNALAMMRDLKNILPGVFAINIGECQFHDEKSRKFFTYGLAQEVSHAISIDFFDQSMLDNFFSDPITHPAKNEIVKIAENGYSGIIGFDLENKEI